MRRGLFTLMVSGLLVGSVACGPGEVDTPADPPVVLDWPADQGADRYRVQAWSGFQLLFEENVTAPPWELTPNLVRTVAGFDSVTIRVRGLDARGDVVGRQSWMLAPTKPEE